MQREYKVIQWGAGYTGKFSLQYILGTPQLKLVGVKCFTADKEGVDAGIIADVAPVGVTATRDTKTLLALEADCVIYMPRDALADPSVPGSPSAAWVADLVALLESGKNVVSSLAPPGHWGHLMHGESFRKRLQDACIKGKSTLFFTGFDPGFTTDALAFCLSSVVGRITQIRTWEILDYSTYPVPEIMHTMGFGMRPETLSATAANITLMTWGSALHVLGDAFGVRIDDITVEPDIYLAPQAYVTTGGTRIDAGTIAALRFAVVGHVRGKRRFVINHVTRMGQDVAPEWPRLGRDGGYRIEIDAFPPFRGDFPMGEEGGTGASFSDAMAMTAARCVNSIEAVVSAGPGYRTFLELAPLGGKYALAE